MSSFNQTRNSIKKSEKNKKEMLDLNNVAIVLVALLAVKLLDFLFHYADHHVGNLLWMFPFGMVALIGSLFFIFWIRPEDKVRSVVINAVTWFLK